jgi:hypothetical protein
VALGVVGGRPAVRCAGVFVCDSRDLVSGRWVRGSSGGGEGYGRNAIGLNGQLRASRRCIEGQRDEGGVPEGGEGRSMRVRTVIKLPFRPLKYIAMIPQFELSSLKRCVVGVAMDGTMLPGSIEAGRVNLGI